MDLSLSSVGGTRWSDTFKTYADWNRREAPALFEDQTRKLATELYTQTAAIAPSREQIATDVKSQGWEIPAFFKDGRLGRGTSRMWGETALRRKERGRGRPSNRTQAKRQAFLDRARTMAEMHAFVIQVRVRARLYLASGWLGAISDLGGKLNAKNGDIDPARGGAIILRSPGRVEVTLWNRTPGIEKMNAKHHFVEKAIAYRQADMGIYIVRKMQEAGIVTSQAA